MMSRNSFLVNMKENLKRRKGIAVLYSVAFLLLYPIGLTLLITSMRGYMSQNPNYRENLTETFAVYFGMNAMTALFVTLLAVISAVQGFSYLFKKQKLDMYMSVPVSKERRFAIIYLNGILLYVIPHLISILISLCIGAGSGVYIGWIIKTLIFSYLSYLIYYLAVYNIAIVAVMLTGNILLALCGAGVLLFYEGGVRLLLVSMSSVYFDTFSSYSDNIWYRTAFSPAVLFLGKFIGSLEGQNVPYLLEKFGLLLLKNAVIVVITGIAGYLLYAVRPAESCNKAIAFKKARPFIKVALMVPLSLVIGILFYEITNNTAMTILGFVLGIFLCHSILEVIFEFDLKAVFRSFPSMIVGTVLVFAVFAVFKFDLTGYDKWVPDPAQVESVAVNSYALSFDSVYDLEKGAYMDSSRYMLEHMKITDVENFCALMRSVAESENTASKDKDDMEADKEKKLGVTVKYRMKNGKEKFRYVMIPYEAHKEELNRLLSGKEYQTAAFQILNEGFDENVSLEGISFSNGITSRRIEEADLEKVLQAYKDDLSHYDMETVAEQCPAGILNFNFSVVFEPLFDQYGPQEQILYYTMPVYENFEKTMDYLGEKELLEDWRQSLSNIDKVTINYYSEEWISRDFNDQNEIEAILPALIPGTIADYRIFNCEEDSEYSAYISYRRENAGENYETGYFEVEADLLPDFAK